MPDEAATKCSNCDADFSAFVRRVCLYPFLIIIMVKSMIWCFVLLRGSVSPLAHYLSSWSYMCATAFVLKSKIRAHLATGRFDYFYVIMNWRRFSLKFTLFDMRFCKDYE